VVRGHLTGSGEEDGGGFVGGGAVVGTLGEFAAAYENADGAVSVRHSVLETCWFAVARTERTRQPISATVTMRAITVTRRPNSM